MNRLFYIEADVITQTDFELIHRYIRKRLDVNNKQLLIKSIPLNEISLNTKIETFINSLGVSKRDV